MRKPAAVRGRSWSIAVCAVVVAWLAMSSAMSAARDSDPPSQIDRLPATDRVEPAASPADIPVKLRRAGSARREPAMASPHVPANAPSSPQADKELDLGAAVFKSAFEAADQDYARSTSRGAFGSEPSTRQTQVDRSFQAAQIEGCGSDPLKFDPLPVWGDFVMGVFAVPYMLHAMATGHCKL